MALLRVDWRDSLASFITDFFADFTWRILRYTDRDSQAEELFNIETSIIRFDFALIHMCSTNLHRRLQSRDRGHAREMV